MKNPYARARETRKVPFGERKPIVETAENSGLEQAQTNIEEKGIPKEFPSAELSIPQKKKGGKGFLVSAKRLMLTYVQVPGALTPQDLLEQLEKKLPIDKYIIGREKYDDGGKHFHVVVICSEKQDIQNPRFFDVEFEGKSYGCNCQGVRYLSLAINNVKKEGQFITNMDIGEERSKSAVARELLAMAGSKAIEATLVDYIENHREHALSSKSVLSIERALKRNQALKRNSVKAIQESIQTPFEVEDFLSLPEIEEWTENGFQPTLIMVGLAGTGKTQFVKALAKKHGWLLLMMNHKEGLRALREVFDAICWDDVSLDGIDEDTLLAMLETNENKTIRILHGSVNKRQGLIQIFTFNEIHFRELIPLLKRHEYSRRCIIVIVPEDFIINRPSVVQNINISSHTHIYNNPNTIAENDEAIRELERRFE